VAIPGYAKIKAKDVSGTWNYTVQTPEGELTGMLKFTKEKKGKLSGEVITDDGNTFPMTKVEIRDGDVVYFEIKPDYEVMKVSMNIEGDKYKGVVGISQGDIPVFGEKEE
jgi:hypothetical protein